MSGDLYCHRFSGLNIVSLEVLLARAAFFPYGSANVINPQTLCKVDAASVRLKDIHQ